jgi:hypothetical protein
MLEARIVNIYGRNFGATLYAGKQPGNRSGWTIKFQFQNKDNLVLLPWKPNIDRFYHGKA